MHARLRPAAIAAPPRAGRERTRAGGCPHRARAWHTRAPRRGAAAMASPSGAGAASAAAAATVRFTSAALPSTARIKDDAGLPFGCAVRPLAARGARLGAACAARALPAAADVARCEACLAYISPSCHHERRAWRCALCDHVNTFTREQQRGRYGVSASHRRDLPELMMSVIELADDDVDASSTDVSGANGAARALEGLSLDGAHARAGAQSALQSSPCYFAVFDLTGSEAFLDASKGALAAALEALPAVARVAIVTVSDRVGLLDVQGDAPVALHLPILDGSVSVDIDEAAPLERLLAPVGECGDEIMAALDALSPCPPPPGGSHPPQCLGAALDALCRAGARAGGFLAARALCFLAGAPSLGLGATVGAEADICTREYGSVAQWYEDLSALALSAGVACDLLVVAERPCGLEALAKLAEGSGGVLYHYADGAEGAAVPQDVFRLLSREAALGATLRLRTSCEFKVARAYGHLAADGDVDELYHAVCLDEHSTFMFDFEFVEAEGFDYDVAPTVQLAIRYSLLVPVRPAGGGVVDEDDANGARSHAGENGGVGSRGGAVAGFRVERRLRIVTAQARVAKRAKALYDSARCDVVMALLTHKIILASRAEGVPEARLLLRDWLTILVANYNQTQKLAHFGDDPAQIAAGVDTSFKDCAALAPIPRLVYGLLRSDLLSDSPSHPDARAHCEHFWRSLEPSLLQLAVYPAMCSYYDENTPAFPSHSLSRAAITTSGAQIFLLDALTSLVCYCAPAAQMGGGGSGSEGGSRGASTFPPAQGSVLRELMNAKKQERLVTPRVRFIRGGTDDSTPFSRMLIEEPLSAARGDAGGGDGSAADGFVQYLDALASDVTRFMVEGP